MNDTTATKSIDGATASESRREPQKCQAEDQGGHLICDQPATLQTKRAPIGFYCEAHRINRHVWDKNELEPLGSPARREPTGDEDEKENAEGSQR
jgi:hypothetical protein